MIANLRPLSQEFIEASPEALQPHHCRWRSAAQRSSEDVKQKPVGSEVDEKPQNER